MRSTTENLLLWEQRINERIKSGMTIEEWCKKSEISRHKYLYWNHKISQKQQAANDMEFAEVTSIISNTHESVANQDKSEDFRVLFNNIQITVPSNFNQDSLAGLMKVLKQL